MYWYKTIIKSTAKCLPLALAVGFNACSSPAPVAEPLAEDQLFDIPSFFQKEIDALTKLQPQISKTVMKDKVKENKTLKIKSWDTELSSFKGIDLRKTAYKGFIHRDSAEDKVIYTFTDDKIDLSKVEITYQHHQPYAITIERKVDNLLYNTVEKLNYIKGKSYSVEKQQKVLVLGESNYAIAGTIQ